MHRHACSSGPVGVSHARAHMIAGEGERVSKRNGERSGSASEQASERVTERGSEMERAQTHRP
jgi:hypothetical protein